MDARRLSAFDGYGGVVPLDGSPSYDLSLDGQTTYSPDGTHYVVVAGRSLAFYEADGSRVSDARLDPGRDARLSADPANGWSPGGDRFAVLANGEIKVVDVASGTVTVLTEASAPLNGDMILGIRGFSPQGDRILYATGVLGDDWYDIVAPALWSIGVDGSDPRLVVAGTTQGEWPPR